MASSNGLTSIYCISLSLEFTFGTAPFFDFFRHYFITFFVTLRCQKNAGVNHAG